MSIERSGTKELKVRRTGVAGILTDDSFQIYQRCESAGYFCSPSEDINQIFQDGITAGTQADLSVAVVEHVREFKRQAPWMNTITFATPALEVLSPEQLSELGLELFSLNEVIAEHCVQGGIRRPALLGTEWDAAPDSPLVRTLAKYDIEAQTLGPEQRQTYRSLAGCVFSSMRGYVNRDGLMKEASDFCVDVVNRLLYESAGTLDAFIICNSELRSFIPRFHQCLKGERAAIPIINAFSLHLTALSTKSSKNPPS